METKSGENEVINSYKPMVAGILLLIAGLLGIYTWISAAFFYIDPTIIESLQQGGIEITMEQIEAILGICSIIGFVVSIFPLLGGILSIKRKMWGFCIVMSIIGLFAIGPLMISSILSFISLILIALSKNEFHLKIDKEITIDDEYS
jgi:lysylphosphatidylglycerol synthetase-like protein (DUF2156 family)